MPSLIARYLPPNGKAYRLWTHELVQGKSTTIGRTHLPSAKETGSDLGVSHRDVADEHSRFVSTNHATIRWDGTHLWVRLRSPKPPQLAISWPAGRSKQAGTEFQIRPGESFRIGERFEFALDDRSAKARSLPHDLVGRIELDTSSETTKLQLVDLTGMLALLDNLIRSHLDDHDEGGARKGILTALMKLLPAATQLAFIAVPPDDKPPEPRDFHGPISFSRRLARHVAMSQETTLRARPQPNSDADAAEDGETPCTTTDWQMYIPLVYEPGMRATEVLYISGNAHDYFSDMEELMRHPDMAQARQVAQVLAGFYKSIKRVQREQQKSKKLIPFLPHAARNIWLRDHTQLDAAMEPRVLPISVLFCDLRGSCKLAERYGDDLNKLWRSVLGEALLKMSDPVVNNDGVIGSYQGDAILAFWGWPPTADTNHPVKAAKAAREIDEVFQVERQRDDGNLRDLYCGIGIAAGPAVVGQLGTRKLRKLDVIGPVANLASRLESMTKAFGVTCLIDQGVQEKLPTLGPGGEPTARRIGKVIPAGMTASTDVYELLPPEADSVHNPLFSYVRRYERALERFEEGRWLDAREILEPIRTKDGPAKFLAGLMGDHDVPPKKDDKDWPTIDGKCAIPMTAK